MSEIFISYKREERDKAHAIAEALAKRGFSVWWDIDLLPGDRFIDEITAVIEHAKVAVVLWSEAAVESDFVRDEASRALDRDILIPVRLDNCELPLPFGALHTLNLDSWDGSIEDPLLEPLIAGIEKKIGRISKQVKSKDEVVKILERPKGEVDFWKTISEHKPQEIKEYQAYMDRYGEKAIFSELATIRIEKLNVTIVTDKKVGRKKSLPTIGALATIVGTLIAAITFYLTFISKPKNLLNLTEAEDIINNYSPESLHSNLIPAIQTVVKEKGKLVGAKLIEADLTGLKLPKGGKFKNVDLTKAILDDSYLVDVVFESTQLKGSYFRNTNVKNATFIGGTLEDAFFKCSDMRNAKFVHMNFSKIAIEGSKLNNFVFERGWADTASIVASDLRGVRFNNSIMSGVVSFPDSNISAINLDELNFSLRQPLKWIYGYAGAACYDGENPPIDEKGKTYKFVMWKGERFDLKKCATPPKYYTDCWGSESWD